MRPPLVALWLGSVVLASAACASRNGRPQAMYGLDLRQPHVFEQPTGTNVPCGKGVAWLFGDLLWTCRIDRPTTIEGYDFPAGATLWFRGDGTLEQADYLERQGALSNGGDFRATRVVKFDDWEEIVSSTVEPFRRRQCAKDLVRTFGSPAYRRRALPMKGPQRSELRLPLPWPSSSMKPLSEGIEEMPL